MAILIMQLKSSNAEEQPERRLRNKVRIYRI